MIDRKQNRLLAFDEDIQRREEGLIAGVDEAGRGPLAGPVVAGAVILSRKSSLEGLNDSKKLTPMRREKLYWEICSNSRVGIGVVDEKTIDSINIYQASRLAMKRAVLQLHCSPRILLIDGPLHLELPITQKPIIKGDSKSASIAAASIIAKVYRDAWMQELDLVYPLYKFKQNKGYPTKKHLAELKAVGPCAVHRRSFAPVRETLRKSRV